MIAPGSAGWWPDNARPFNTRWMLSAMLRHDPPTGVNNGMTPCENGHRINAVDVCPARLSRTNGTRNAGHRSQVARDTSAVGNVARTAVNSRSSHGCRTVFG